MKNWLILILLFPLTVFSQETDELIKKGIDTDKYIPKGIAVGIKAPEIIAKSINGELINTNEIIKEKNVVIIFYRGKWCPICNRYLANLSDSLNYITDKNAEVLVVGPETFENTEKTGEKADAKFMMIPDTSLKILKDYDVLFNVTKKYQGKIKTFLFTDIAENNHQEEAQLPVPATYIIGKDGTIKWRHFDYDYSKRASVKAIIEHLE
jgi:peroxiredoxin